MLKNGRYKMRAEQFLRARGNGKNGNEKSKPQQREYIEQKAVVQWARYRAEDVSALRLLHAIPNGGSRSKRQDPKTGKWYSPEANRFKAMGVVAGVPDLFLPSARRGYHGLYIEMKAEGGKTSPEQDKIIAQLQSEGYLVKVCVGRAEAIEALIWYLDLPPKLW